MLKWLLTRHWLLTLIVMGISAIIFGLASIDLFSMLRGNLGLVFNGELLFEGALQQLLELIGYGLISVIFYVIFKACEKILVERILK